MDMTRLYLVSIFAIVFLDLFDKLYDRHGVKFEPWKLLPDRPIVFGRIELGRAYGGGPMYEKRFLFVKIPFIRTWGYIPGIHPMMSNAFGWRTHKLQWIEDDGNPDPMNQTGWHIVPPFEG